MAYDDVETEWHLTPRGWIQGTRWFFGKTDKEIPPPHDRVLTMVDRTYQRSGWSKEENTQRETWRSASLTPEELSDLRRKYTDPS
jgi:hypothetical protein